MSGGSENVRKQLGTSPGFGPPTEPLAPLNAESPALDDETLSDTAEPSSASRQLPPNHESLPIHPALGSSALAHMAEAHMAEAHMADAHVAEARGADARMAPAAQVAARAEPPRPAPVAPPAAAAHAPAPAPMQIPMPVAPEALRRNKGTPAVDIDLIYERRSAPLPDQPWIFLEVWTRNTVYQLDSHLVCVDVVDQATRRSIADHALRGARLVGGQSRDGESMELSHPFPRPGSEAVFEQASGRQVRFSQTSTVTRVVMRLRVLTVAPDQLLPTWEEVTGKLTHERRR